MRRISSARDMNMNSIPRSQPRIGDSTAMFGDHKTQQHEKVTILILVAASAVFAVAIRRARRDDASRLLCGVTTAKPRLATETNRFGGSTSR